MPQNDQGRFLHYPREESDAEDFINVGLGDPVQNCIHRSWIWAATQAVWSKPHVMQKLTYVVPDATALSAVIFAYCCSLGGMAVYWYWKEATLAARELEEIRLTRTQRVEKPAQMTCWNPLIMEVMGAFKIVSGIITMW